MEEVTTQFTNREVELMFKSVHEKLDRMEGKLDYTNGKVRKLYLYLTVVGSITATLFATNGTDLIRLITAFV